MTLPTYIPKNIVPIHEHLHRIYPTNCCKQIDTFRGHMRSHIVITDVITSSYQLQKWPKFLLSPKSRKDVNKRILIYQEVLNPTPHDGIRRGYSEHGGVHHMYIKNIFTCGAELMKINWCGYRIVWVSVLVKFLYNMKLNLWLTVWMSIYVDQ